MAFNPQSIQMLSLILENQRRGNEASAQRGHEVSMMTLAGEQRAMESEIGFQREQYSRLTDSISHLQSQLDAMGVDYSGFGTDDQSRDMIQRVSGSLANQASSLSDIVSMKEDQLTGLRTASNLFSRGMSFAAGLIPVFDVAEDGAVSEMDSVHLELSQALNAGRIDEFEERLFELADSQFLQGASAQEKNAYLQGVRNFLTDRQRYHQEEQAAQARSAHQRDIVFQNMQMRHAEAQHSMNLDSSYMNQIEFFNSQVDRARAGLTDIIPRMISAHTMEFAQWLGETSRQDRNAYNKKLDEVVGVLSGGANAFSTEFIKAAKARIDPSLSDEERAKTEASIDSYFANFAQQFVKIGQEVVTGIAVAPENVFANIRSATLEFDRVIKEHGSIEKAIDADALSPDTFGTVMIAANPFIFSSWDAGFDQLEVILSASSMENAYRTASPSDNVQAELRRIHGQNHFQSINELKSFAGGAQMKSLMADFANQAQAVITSREERVKDPEYPFTASDIQKVRDDIAIDRTINTRISKLTDEVITLQNQIQRAMSDGVSGDDKGVKKRQERIKEISKSIEELRKQQEEIDILRPPDNIRFGTTSWR